MENRDVNKKASVADLISLLLREPKIQQKVTASLKPEAREYNNVEVNEQLQRIRFGKHSWGGFGGFWNNLIKCCDHITFDDFYIKVWDALVEMTAGMPAHEAVLEGLSRETLLNGIHNKDTKILHRFFDVCQHLTSDGYWKSQGMDKDINNRVRSRRNEAPYADEVEVTVEPRRKRQPTTVRVVDSVGDVFEVVDVRWIGGR
jgi:hypothetical protein